MTAGNPSDGRQPPSVAFFVTCVIDMLTPEVGVAAVRVLRATGATVVFPEGQTCCGQPAWNAGFHREAARVAATSLDALTAVDVDAVVVPAGSCTTMIRLYWPQLFELSGDVDRAERARALAVRVQEFSEHLVREGVPDREGSVPSELPRRRCAYHASCHMLRELHIRDEPILALEAVGRDVAEWDDADRCCGFGGTFSVRLPETSIAMADAKLDSLPEDVDEIVGADMSCLLQLGTRAAAEGRAVRVRHLAEVMADQLAAGRGDDDG